MTASDLGVVWPPPVAPLASPEPTSRHRLHQTVKPARDVGPVTLSTTQMLVLLPIRIFLAAGWLRAGVEKCIDPAWWRGDALRMFLHEHRAQAIPPFRAVLDHGVAPWATVVAFVVMATEIGCGVAIAAGRPLRAALRWSVVLNLAFMLSGPVNPSVFYLLMEMVLLLAIADGTIGRTPSQPGRRTVALICTLLVAAALLVRFVRTLAPAKVIADPAIVLLFLAVIEIVVLVIRCTLATNAFGSSRIGDRWSVRIHAFACARPATQAAIERTKPRAPDVVTALGWTRSRSAMRPGR